MSKPKKKRRPMTVRELEDRRGRKLERKPAKPGVPFAYVDDDELWDYGRGGEADRIAENRSHEPPHMLAHFEKVHSTPGVDEHMVDCDRKRFRELRRRWRVFGSRGLVILAGLAVAQGVHKRRLQRDRKTKKHGVGIGAAGHLKNAIAWHRKHFAHVIPPDLLDKLEPFFVEGWNMPPEADPRSTAIAEMMQRAPAATDEGQPIAKTESVYDGADRVAFHRFIKLFKDR
jgi:hypothetical protein